MMIRPIAIPAIALATLVALSPPAKPSAAAAAAAGPYTAAQAASGSKEYAENCSRCHGAALQGVSAPALHGAASGLAGDDVATAFTFISTQMPAGNPGSLTQTQYLDILAFILSRNGHAAGAVKLSPATAKASKIKL